MSTTRVVERTCMRAVRRLGALTLCTLGLVTEVPAQNIDGRYLGNVFHYDYTSATGPRAIEQASNRTSHLYDLFVRQDTPNKLRFDLGASLRYDSQFTYESDIFRARAFGELGSRSWRLHAQFVPWQRTQPSSDIPSRRDLQLGFDLTPPHLPHLLLNYTRADRRTRTGEFGSDDMRADLAYGRGPVSGRVGVRRLESDIGTGERSRTDEFRGGVQGGYGWRGLAVSGAYDAILTANSARELSVDQDIQRTAGDATWILHRQVNLSVNGLHRWGSTRDNTRQLSTPIGETSLGANLSYVPVPSLLLRTSRSYYKSKSAIGNQISDYLRLEALYQHEILRRTNFRTGYSQTIDIDSQGGSVPNSAAYVTVDGDLRRNVWARAETRLARAPSGQSGLQWYFGVDTRTRPSRSTTFDVLWNRYALPEIEGLQQQERTWEIKAGYDPRPGATLIVSYRRLDGEGRIARSETLWSGNGTFRLRHDTVFSLYGSTRSTGAAPSDQRENVLGMDLTLQPRDELQLRGTLKYSDQKQRTDVSVDGVRAYEDTTNEQLSYGVILTRTF